VCRNAKMSVCYLIGPNSLFGFRLRAMPTIIFWDIPKFGDSDLMFSFGAHVFSASGHFLLLDSGPASERVCVCVCVCVETGALRIIGRARSD
jgi:hypothetical protein